ncbi:MAG: acyl-ACP--UDP-N-acetylglucosamine O-acyltransferase [Pseudomonadota bacterium]
MSVSIHPMANVEPGAELGDGVTIGPFAHVGAEVILGAGTTIHNHASVVGRTELGEACAVYPNSSIGGAPQSLGFKPDPASRLRVGARTVFRENTTAHAGLPKHSGTTEIGSDCYFMHGSHVGHDCHVGNNCVLAALVCIGGHCTIGETVWMGGLCALHQFTQVGDHAFIGGGSVVVGDVIPFGIVAGNKAALAGLNVIGLSRRGFSRDRIKALRKGYKAIFRSDRHFSEAVSAASATLGDNEDVAKVLAFIEAARERPLCMPERRR